MIKNLKDHSSGSGFQNERLVLISAALVVILIYANTLTGPFIFDDRTNILENPHIRLTRLGYNDLKEVVLKGRSINRPVANISFALNYYIHRYNVVGYHLVNILIHITGGLILYLLVKTTLHLPQVRSSFAQKKWIPFFTALLWMIHPLQTQSVSYIVQRMNSMAVMFYILSLLLFVKFRTATQQKRKWILFGGCVTSGALAWGTKEITATLPFVIFLYEWFFFQNLSFKWLKRHVFAFAAVMVLFVLLAWVYFGAHPFEKMNTHYSIRDFTVGQRMLTELRVVVFYLSLLFYPHPSRLNLTHEFSLSNSLFKPPTTVVCLVIIIVSIFLAIYFARRERVMSFCILWIFVNLVIESSVVGLELVFEHRMYLPSMLAILLIVVAVFRLFKAQWLVMGLLLAAAALCAIWTYQRNSVWADDIALWRDCVNKSPHTARAYTNLASALARKGQFNEAVARYQAALRLKPNYAQPYYSIGVILARQRNLDGAISHFRKALQIDPKNQEAQNNLGAALFEQGKPKEAIIHLRNALLIDPDYPEAHYNLGIVLRQQKDLTAAIEHFKIALRLNPGYARAHNNLGITLRQTGHLEEAKKHFEEALRLYPGYEDARRNLEEISKAMQ